MKNIQMLIKEERLKQGVSQKTMAKLSGLTQPQLSNFEQGRDAYLSSVTQIADVLDMRLIVVPKESLKLIERALNSPKGEPESLLKKYAMKDEE